MTRKQKPDKDLDTYLRGDSPLSRAYRAGAGEYPPELLDARIRREAHAALGKRKVSSPWLNRWVPLAAAAVIVMSVSVLVFRAERVDVPLPASGDAPAAATTPTEDRQRRSDARETDKPARRSSAEPLKKETASASVPEPATTPAESAAPASRAPMKLGVESPKPVAPASETRQKKDRLTPGASDVDAREESAPAGRMHGAASSLSMADQSRSPASATASVTAVQVSGQPGAYRFNVTIRSPDKGCAQYANWWEVVSLDGRLLYRRVLLHSHVDEQPFTRGGGPVPVNADTEVWVRAHLHPQGYGGTAYRGSVKNGFRPATPPSGFAANLSKVRPLPTDCAF